MQPIDGTVKRAELPSVPAVSVRNGMDRVPCELVNRWLNDPRLQRHDDLHDLIATGRDWDGSFRAHPSVINQIIEALNGWRVCQEPLKEAKRSLMPDMRADSV
jgi:hypothetical protein